MSPRKRKQPEPDLGTQQQSDRSSSSDSKQLLEKPSSSVEPPPKLAHGNAKYNRIHYACVECYRRKQKCNRERPCQHCIERGIPESCTTYQSRDDNLDNLDTGQRLRRIEHLLDDYLPTILLKVDKETRPLSTSPSHPANGQDGAQQQDLDDLEPEGRLSPETGLYNNGPTSHITSILGGLPGSPPRIQPLNLPIRTVGPSSDFDESVMQYGRPAPPSHELLGALISRDHCDVLTDRYLTQIDWMRQPLPKRRLRDAFDGFWQSGPKIAAQTINIFAIMCNLCAIAALSVQHVLFPSRHQERSQLARRFHYAGRRALLMSAMLGRQDVDQIMAWILSCHFLVLDRRFGETYIVGASVVPAALAIGLHRDGTKLGLPAQDAELRRRVWAAVYCMDRALAVHTGRPALIDDRLCDTRLVDDQMDLDSMTLCTAASRAQLLGLPPPSTYTLTFYRQQLARLEGEAAAFSQTIGSQISIGDVLALDHKIRRFQEMLPPYFHARLTEDGIYYNRSLDSTYPFLLTHRFLIHSDITGLRIMLLRPFLLRSRRSIGAKFAPTREACIEAALHNVEMLRTSVRDLRGSVPTPEQRLVWRAQIGTQSWFQSLLVCGLGLLMDLFGPIASRLKSHLEYYIEEYHDKGFIAMDDMSEREAEVISMFLSRFEQMMEAGASEQGPSNTGQSTSDSEAWQNRTLSDFGMAGRDLVRSMDGRQTREARSAVGSILAPEDDTVANGNTEPDKTGVYITAPVAAVQREDALGSYASSSATRTAAAPPHRLSEHVLPLDVSSTAVSNPDATRPSDAILAIAQGSVPVEARHGVVFQSSTTDGIAPLRSHHADKDEQSRTGGWQRSDYRPWSSASADALLDRRHSHTDLHSMAARSASLGAGNRRTMVDKSESERKARNNLPERRSVSNEPGNQPSPITSAQHGGQGDPVLNGVSPYTDTSCTAKDFQVPASSTRFTSALGMPYSSSLDGLLSPFEAFGSGAAMTSASTSGFQSADMDPAYWQALIDKILS